MYFKRVAEERADGERQMQWEHEEKECACRAAMPPPEQMPEEAAMAAWESAFPWAGPPPPFMDLATTTARARTRPRAA